VREDEERASARLQQVQGAKAQREAVCQRAKQLRAALIWTHCPVHHIDPRLYYKCVRLQVDYADGLRRRWA